MLRIISLIAVVIGLASCATDYSKKSASEIAQEVTVSNSEFDSHKFFWAPPIRKSPELFVTYTTRLGANIDKKSGITFYSISTVWEYQGSSWMFFSSPALPGAIELQSGAPIRKVVSCQTMICTYSETINSLIPLAELIKSAEALRVRYNTNLGPRIIEIPRNYIDGYMQGLKRLGVSDAPSNAESVNGAVNNPAPVEKPVTLKTKFSFTAENASYKQGCSRAVVAESVEPYKEIYSAQCDGGKKIFIVCTGQGCVVQ